MNREMERILPQVQKPARYVGGEYRQIVKNKNEVDVRVAFCFPDTYEIGMSNIGMRILYGVMNNMDGVWCERAFAPWGDMEEQMRSHNIPLWALESQDPVKDFDMIAFSVGYEMSYTNILNMLNLSGIPLHASEREGLHNIVFAGGTCMYNPEPLAPFLDFCSLGEGEDLTIEIVELYRRAKLEQWDKPRFLREVAKLPGVYVPSLYEHRYAEDGTLSEIVPLDGAPKTVTKRIVQNLDAAYYPTKAIVPSTEIVHDRINLELFRGCIRGCRFCQAGYCYRPVRAKTPETLIRQAKELVEDSGMTEITLSSLSTSDYKRLPELADGLLDYCMPRNINLSLPSLRADNFSDELMQKVQKVRKSGLTFAPEAGTQRLRDAINKNVTEEEVLRSCATAFAGGWSSVKLYFMLGLPTETDEDVLAIADLVEKVWLCWRENTTNRARGVRIHVSTAFFVPKPFTPFQWEAQLPPEEYQRRVQMLRDAFRRNRSVDYDYHAPDLSRLEAVLARGDRRIAPVLERAVELGVKLDGWDEYFDYKKWLQAFADCGVDLDFYATRERPCEEVLPWDSISVGVRKEYLASERKQAYASRITPDCRTKCTGCGANLLYTEGNCDD
ncbi:MAG: TIGR03960 family B12-binding radical SAM protein [Oscillospiraceae bacterium]|nr:TIGR03960 family B12-binding radical SAM protein [Oscillospiraceae bacterium]